MFSFEIEAEGTSKNHAEENVIDEAKKQNLHIQKIGASKDICLECQELIQNENILSATLFSGKKSRGRK